MAAQQDRSAVAADHRSILPNAAGVPWWGAVAIALIATAIGIAFDAGSGDKELTTVFAALYVMGCIAAVVTVQQSAVFTAVIQPPLILFCAVPSAYWLFHGGSFAGLKAVVINCGYPLIERFPLMLFTTATVLLIGMVRWYLGMLNQPATAKAADDTGARRRPPLVDKLSALLTAALNRSPAHAIERPAARTPRERRAGERPRRATPAARGSARQGTARRSTTTERRRAENGSVPTRSRHIRPPMGEVPERDRPRRRRPASESRDEPLQRRQRPAPDRRDEPPRRRGEPASRAYPDPRARDYRPADSPPRRRPSAAASRGNGSSSTHHPVSQVRYRKAPGDESGTPSPGRPRRQRNAEVDSWEYDI